MSKRLWIVAGFTAAVAVGWQLADVAVAQPVPDAAPAQNLSDVAAPRPGLPQLTPTSNGQSIHIFPTVEGAKARARAGLAGGPLVYHAGGSIMPAVTLYAIYWIPAKLQNGGATSMPVHYQNFQSRLLVDYPDHGIDNNNTQYFQTIGTTTTYVANLGAFGGVFVDTAPYPASGCTDSLTPGACITDAQIQAEIKRVMGVKGWTGGLRHMFLLYTSSGEGSCFTSASTSCAYTNYCAYHGSISGTTPIIYANMPFGNLSVCQVAGTPSPNAYAVADAVMDVATHEISEAITDPLLDAWFDSSGNEIGDLCNFFYGPNTWDASKANQSWKGHFYEVQEEYDNHTGSCAQVGP